MKVQILHKYKTLARREARLQSTARVDGRSVFIKRYPGKRYHVIMVHVTEKQRSMRDMFAEASRLAKEDMKRWNRVRHWYREARRRGILGGYRAAVAFYYKKLREENGELTNDYGEMIMDRGYVAIDSGQRVIDDWVRRVDICRSEVVWRLAG
ncbi:MAG: hypothetical protein Q4C30_03545 [Bacteroidia bacterium]|nr:hypothetical protein [Bacteroidia bacterium]